ncbi:glycosyltransferase family 2 protein [Hymenobacter arizonensis]|uniref:Glycosyltransferase, GT2 family n=1 Tax=Hymenobacter arizonensis TaxID=1227077 RepID=A0A1I5SYZ3_HYMAR|nr:glycosyltransferase [Hymenobacter arizonensis]SFP75938.1 Glycosyltransferase, GT2 family [Hymenobacter arizonensis]
MTPGLSVLIPVFNWDVNELVDALLAQRADWPGPIEIILFDDGSREETRAANRPLACRPGVRYHELPHNVGRAAIRNQLVAASERQEWLLLLDNDSLLPDAHFLARYAAARHLAPLLIGGTCYTQAPPAHPASYFRWYYGRNREARPATVRQQAPHAQLAINNALMHAAILTQFPFDEELKGYGHEDTKLGLELARAQVPIVHLDNPVLHMGLEPADIFLDKSRQAVRNLAYLYRTTGLGTDTQLLQTALRLQRFGLAPATRSTLRVLSPSLRSSLLSDRPSLRKFDLLKLYWILGEL